MLSSAIIIILTILYDPCLALNLSGDMYTSEAPPNSTKLKCKYTVHKDTTLSSKEWPQDYDPFVTDTNSLEECIAFCDKKQYCVGASYYPNAKGGISYPKCEGLREKGFATLKLRPSKSGHGVAQLVPNSCNKPVATPTPVGCSPRTITDPESGCKYEVTCNQEMKRKPPYAMSVAQVKDTAACFKYLHDPYGPDTPGFGYTFYQGGTCMVNVYNETSIPTAPRPNTETAQLIEGSC